MLKLQAQSSRALSEALQTASKCMAKRNTMAILDSVLLSDVNGTLMFTSATPESQLTIKAPLTVYSGSFTQPVALPVVDMVSFMSALPDSVVNMTLDDNSTMSIDYCIGNDDKVKSGQVSMTYQDGSKFPVISGPQGESTTHIVMPSATLLYATEQAKIFCAKDEVRRQLGSLCIDILADTSECYLVATDGRILMKNTYTDAKEPFFKGGDVRQYLILNEFFRALSAFVGKEYVDIMTDGDTLSFSSGDTEFICKSVEGNYVNYNAIIPTNNSYHVTFNKREMLETLKRVSIFGNRASGLAKIVKDGMFLNVSSSDFDFNTTSSEQVLIIDQSNEAPMTLGINTTYFSNAINSIESENIVMSFCDPKRPFVMRPDTNNAKQLALCMPMQVD